jgi:hypothetical protein
MKVTAHEVHMEGTVHEELYTFLIISRSVLLTSRNVSGRSCTQNPNTCSMFNDFVLEDCAVYEIV